MIRKLCLIVFLLCVGSSAWGVTYYIDPTCGSSGNGTTTTCGVSGPFKTWAEVTWTAGNTYSQKGGTTTYENITVGASGTAGSVVTLNSYGTGRATINGIIAVASGSWTADDPVAGTYSQASIWNQAWYEDGVPLQYGASASTLTAGQVFWGGGKNYYKPSTGTPAAHTVQRASAFGVDLGSYNYITIDNLSFTNSSTGVGNSTGGPVGSGVSNSNITITNCTFDDTAWGVQILNNNVTSSAINISSNTLSYTGNGIELGSGGTGYFTGVTISNNTITYCSQKKGTSNLWRISDGTYKYTNYIYDSEGIGTQNLNNSNVYLNNVTGLCRGIIHYVISPSNGNTNNFYRNYVNVAQEAFAFAPEGGATFYNNKAYYNIMIGGQYDATYSGGYTVGLYLASPTSPVGTNYIYNNTIISSGYVGVGGFLGLANYEIKNNIIYGSNQTLLQWLVYLQTATNVVFDKNLYYPITNANEGANQWGVASRITFAQWQALGYDISPTPNPADPLFNTGLYTLSDHSPAKWAGVNIGFAGLTDYLGKKPNNPPSIGAYEVMGLPMAFGQ